MLKRIFPLMLLSLLSGCGNYQNLNTADILKPEYVRRSEVLNMTIPQIQQALYDYSAKCTQVTALRVNPSNPNSAIYQTSMHGLTQANPAVIILFTQTGNRTQAVGYTYYSNVGWQSQVDDIFDAIKDPTKCK